MRKYIVLTSVICTNLCLGGIYGWSVFVPKLVSDHGYSTTQTQIVFASVVFFLTSSMLITGKLENKIGPGSMLVICAALLFAGYMVASLSGNNFWILWLGYGVTSGIGIGFGYVTGLAVSIRWFQHKKGFAAGCVIAGYGFGAVFFSVIAQILLNKGWDVMIIFRYISFVFLGVILICAKIVSNPPNFQKSQTISLVGRKELLQSPRFFILAFTAGLGTFPGLMIIGNLKPIALSFGFTSAIAVLALSFLSLGNATGRILGGLIHDRIKSSGLKWVLFLVSLTVLLMTVIDMIGVFGFLILITSAGISYGAMLALIPAQVADEYGERNFGTVYPLTILVHGLAALLAAPLGGYFYDKYQSYQPAFYVAGAIGFLCLGVFCFAYKAPPKIVSQIDKDISESAAI